MLIATLFFTNAWIVLYLGFLQFFNKHIPPSVPVGFIRSDISPEPFEIPLYLIVSLLIVLLIFFCAHFVKKHIASLHRRTGQRIWSMIRIALLAALVALTLHNLGTYPLAHDIFPYSSPESQMTYTLVLFLYLATIIFFIVEGTFLSHLARSGRTTLFIYACVIGLIAVATFEPRFPMVGHDYSYFFGPIWEIIHGKTIYTQISSQYGFLSILILALITKLRLLDIWYLPAFIWLLYIFQYFAVFYVIFRISRSLPLALLSLFSIVTINYFSLFHLPATIPQIGPFRWLPLIASLLLLLRSHSITKKSFVFSVAILSLWMIDSGISLILAFCFTLLLLTLLRKISLHEAVKSFLLLGLFIILIVGMLNLAHIAFGYHPIDISSVFLKLKQYGAAGFGMIPIDQKTFFWFIPLIYFASILYLLKNKHAEDDQKQRPDSQSSIVLFSANITLFASIYFVGRSHPHNFFHISIFALITFFILLAYQWRTTSIFKKVLAALLCIVFLVAYPASQRKEVMTKMILSKFTLFTKGHLFQPEAADLLKKKYKKEIPLIKQIRDDKIVILSDDDTYLFYLSQKENLMNDNSQFTILSWGDLENSLREVGDVCPSTIVGECDLFGRCKDSTPYTITYFNIQPLILSKIEERCNMKYIPSLCTDQLCIAQNQSL